MSRRPALERSTFDVTDVVAAPASAWRAGTLNVDVAALELQARAQPGIAGAQAEIVLPGSPVRIVNVLDVLVPTVKPDDPDATFPGALGRLAPAGYGRTNELGGVAVVSTAALTTVGAEADGEPPAAVIDMAGPCAAWSPWERTTNVVMSYEPAPDAPLAEVDRSIRRASLEVARALARTTIGSGDPARVERFATPAADGDLPAVCVILQVASEGPGADTYLYGAPAAGMVPTVLDPREILDGALTAGDYDWPSVCTPTYFYQRSALLQRLFHEHGKRVCFAGVILTLGYLNGGFEKERMAVLCAKLAVQLGASGAILTTFSSGNSQTDTMLTCQKCEELGVRTTVIIAETNGGLTDHTPAADCIVSAGNEEESAPQWQPGRVIGGGAGQLEQAQPLPVAAYLGATTQTGDTRLQAVSA